MDRAKQEEELLSYLDGKLNEAQLRDLKKRLETSEPLRKRLEELRLIDVTLRASQLETPSSNFTHRVMMNLHRASSSPAISPRNGLLLLCGTIVALLILSGLVSTGTFDTMNDTVSLESIPSSTLTDGIQKSIPISGKLIMNGLIILNLVLAFILLDRTVLRPFFQRRTSQYQ